MKKGESTQNKSNSLAPFTQCCIKVMQRQHKSIALVIFIYLLRCFFVGHLEGGSPSLNRYLRLTPVSPLSTLNPFTPHSLTCATTMVNIFIVFPWCLCWALFPGTPIPNPRSLSRCFSASISIFGPKGRLAKRTDEGGLGGFRPGIPFATFGHCHFSLATHKQLYIQLIFICFSINSRVCRTFCWKVFLRKGCDNNICMLE